ncbi:MULTISPECIES: alpha/beta fold hydrolase [unclassified Streptomyces]|uniref:alpha/beta fold hydrolase n=1 Tax=unclassified Streptomyces TaxID=2593676 RepID=UPI003D93EBBB
MSYTHVTAPTQYVEAGGARHAYRRFGKPGGTPLVFLVHFRGGMDNWDPAITDGLAATREVILFDYAGVAGSSGKVPETFEAFGDDSAAVIRALGITQADVLGFSIGGYIAQTLTLRHPDLVRRLVLVGTGPRAGEFEGQDPKIYEVAGRDPEISDDGYLFLFFEPTETSQQAGKNFLARRRQRTVDVVPRSSMQVAKAQVGAMGKWREQVGERWSELKTIQQPTLVVNGSHDVMVPTINSYILQQHIPGAQLIIYPDSGHGSLFQYPELFVSHVSRFLDSERAFG